MKNLFTPKNIFMIVFFALVSCSMFLLDASSLNYKTITCVIFVLALIFTFVNREATKFNHPVFIGVTAFFAIVSLSSVIATGGKFAITEYTKMVVAYSVFLVICSAGKCALKAVLWWIVSFGAFNAFFSIEGSSYGVIQPFFEELIYGAEIPEYARFFNNRISGILGNANVFVSVLGLSLLCSLYLFTSSNSKLSKAVLSLYMVACGNALFLAFSLGGTFSLGVSILGLLIFIDKTKVFENLYIIFLTVLISLGGVFLTVDTFVHNQKSGSLAPVLSVIIGAVILFGIYELTGKTISKLALKVGKIGFGILIGAIILATSFAFLAYTTTTEISLETNQTIIRTINPAPGRYKVEFELLNPETGVDLYAFSQSEAQNLIGSGTAVLNRQVCYYEDEIYIDIADDATLVKFYLRNATEEEVVLSKLSIVSEEETYDIPLKYVFLNENMANRLQGLQTNNSALIRSQYVKDSKKLFGISPIYGNGLGAFEDKIQLVQDYAYETKYAHNHFLQVLIESGIIGITVFIAMIITFLVALIKIRKKSDVAPYLFAGCVMIFYHGANEFTLSINWFIPLAYAIFATILLASSDEEFLPQSVKKPVYYTTLVVSGIFLLLISGNAYSKKIMSSASLSFSDLENAVKYDFYEKNDYMLSYILNSLNSVDPKVKQNANDYLNTLKDADVNAVARHLVGYYIDMGDFENAFFQANKNLARAPYDRNQWNDIFAVYYEKLFNQNNYISTLQNLDLVSEQIFSLFDEFNVKNSETISNMTLNDNAKYLKNALEGLVSEIGK